MIVLSGVLYNAINRQLAPAEDQGVLFAFVNAPEHTNLDYLTTYTDDLTKTFLAIPEKQNLFAINGFPNTHSAFMGLILKPWGERKRSDLSVMGELQPKFKAVSGVNIFATAPSAIPVGAGDLPIEFVLTYPGDYTRLADVLDKLKAEATRAACSSSPTPTCASRRRRWSWWSTRTAPTSWASPCATSAPRWPRCWAATTSTASRSMAAATR